MSAVPPDDSQAVPQEAEPLLAVMAIVAISFIAYGVVLFISGLSGLVRQLADPALIYETNPTILLVMWPGFIALTYAFLPELSSYRERAVIGCILAIVPTGILPLILVSVLPALVHHEPWSLAGGLFVIFLGFGLLPCLLSARLVILLHPELQVSRQGGHYIDAGALEGELRRIVAKHTMGTFRRPSGWRPSFFGDGGRLTHRDVVRMIESETEELRAATAAARARAEAIQSGAAGEGVATHRVEPSVWAWTETVRAALGVATIRQLRAREAALSAELEARTAAFRRAVGEQVSFMERIAGYERQVAVLTEARREQEDVESGTSREDRLP